jgi:hypothetical protein
VLKGREKILSKMVHKFTHDGQLSAQRWIEKPLEGGSHSHAWQKQDHGKMKQKIVTLYTQHIKHFSCSHDLEDQQDHPQQNVDTLSPTRTNQNQSPKVDCRTIRASRRHRR